MQPLRLRSHVSRKVGEEGSQFSKDESTHPPSKLRFINTSKKNLTMQKVAAWRVKGSSVHHRSGHLASKSLRWIGEGGVPFVIGNGREASHDVGNAGVVERVGR